MLQRVALIGRSLLQIGFDLPLLCNQGVTRGDARFQRFQAFLCLFVFLQCFLILCALLPGEFFEVEILFRFSTCLHLDPILEWLILAWQHNANHVNARSQVPERIIPVLVRLGILLGALVVHNLHSNICPGLAHDIHDLSMDDAVKLSSGARCKHACQRCQNHRGQHARFMKTLHAPFSFFTGEPRPVWPGDVRPIISHPSQIPSSTRGGNRSPVSDRVRHAGFGESTQSQQATIACAAGYILILIA